MERGSPLRVTDLFCGAGLFSAGFKAAGFDIACAVELDGEAVKSYRANVSPNIIKGSVTDQNPVETDVLIAGPPCQGFSTLGRMDPTDARNKLSLDVVRWAEGSDAKVVVIENVPPFLRSPQWRLLAKRLKRLGYEIEVWELNAYDFGTPQLRRRAFTVASKIGPIGEPLATGPGPNVGRVIADLVDAPRGHDDPMHVWPIPAGIAAQRIQLVPPGGDKRDIIRLAPELCPPSWGKMGCQATDVWGRVDPSAPANTLRCTFQNPSKGRYLHPTLNRTLSLREGARLQGIPNEWQMSGRGYAVARQIGNGVPVPLAIAVARQVKCALN